MDWKRIFDSIGLNGTWWQWRILRWQDRVASWFGRTAEQGRHTAYRHKMCPSCGALMDRETKACPSCGNRAPSWAAQFMRRVFGLVLPQWAPVSALMILFCVIHLGAVIVLFGPAQILMPTNEMVYRMGALEPASFLGGQYWRVVTYAFLHLGILHFAFNLTALSQVGPLLEGEIGRARFLVVYTLSAVAAGFAELLGQGFGPMLMGGASGSIFGLIGFGVTYGHFYGGPTGRAMRDFFFRWAVYGFIFGLVVGAANYAHLGGALAGALLGIVIERERLLRNALTPVWSALAAICAVALVLSFVGLIRSF